MLSGPSASGKSTTAIQLLREDSNAVRINRDDLRKMSIPKWSPKREKWIIQAEMSLAQTAGSLKQNIIIDDTNLTSLDEDRWRSVALGLGYTFKKQVLTVPMLDCIARDKLRGEAKVGRQVIERQFLRAGLWKVPEGKQTVIWDLDGTVADLTHRIPWITVGGPCPSCDGKGKIDVPNDKFDGLNSETCVICEGTTKLLKKNYYAFYSDELVIADPPIDITVRWLKACHPDFHIVIVSGRSPENCEDSTLAWLEKHDIKFDHILMRRANIHGPDHEEKQLILDMILKVIPKEDIAFVVDDRPSVVEMWKKNGLKVFPVRGRDDDKFYSEVL